MSAVTLEDLVDRAAIVDVRVRYAYALDSRDWALLATCFADDVVVDMDGQPPIADYAELEAVCRRVLEPLAVSQHLLGNHNVELAGDTATGRCSFHAQHVRAELAPDDKLVIAGTYEDRYVRRDGAWLIVHRRLAVAWTDGNPAVVA